MNYEPEDLYEEDEEEDEEEEDEEECTNCGVYVIVNRDHKIVYIGSTLDIKARLKQHRKDLHARKHANRALQEFFDEHGSESLEFGVLYCFPDPGYDWGLRRRTKEALLKWEDKALLDASDSKFRICNACPVEGGKWQPDGSVILPGKTVVVVNPDGTECIYGSISKAAKAIDVPQPVISYLVRGIIKSVDGYTARYADLTDRARYAEQPIESEQAS